MVLVDTKSRVVIDGYDLGAETGRLRFDDVVVGDMRLNRGSARVDVTSTMNSARLEQARNAHDQSIFPTTVSPESPVLELGYPQCGPFVRCEAGVYFDAYLGVAQKLLDEHHPAFQKMLQVLAQNQLFLRREINTDDYLSSRPGVEGLRTPQDLASLLDAEAARAFPRKSPFKCFLSNSGSEATEAAIKLAQRVKHGRLLERYGSQVEAELMRQLGIPVVEFFRRKEGTILYDDYPMFVLACENAFHGRTLGALQTTFSKSVHKMGVSTPRWHRHIPFNGQPEDLARLIDDRPLPRILEADGGICEVIASGRIPRDLAALFLVEPFQGEGGYRLADAAWLKSLRRTCDQFEILLLADEIQSFGRTGTTFLMEQMGVEPDIVTLAKACVVGITLARAELTRYLPHGWHANTWGGGKIFDNFFACTTIDTFLNYRDPVFEGRGYRDNVRIKGEYLRSHFAWLRDRHSDVFVDFSGLGCMFGITVRRREEIIETSWRRGLKLLPCGQKGEESRIRLLFLADVLTREIDEFARVFDQVLAEVESAPPR